MSSDSKKLKNLFGKKSFQDEDTRKKINKSPTPKPKLTKKEIEIKIEFVERELLQHKKNENHVMIAYKNEELKNLRKLL